LPLNNRKGSEKGAHSEASGGKPESVEARIVTYNLRGRRPSKAPRRMRPERRGKDAIVQKNFKTSASEQRGKKRREGPAHSSAHGWAKSDWFVQSLWSH